MGEGAKRGGGLRRFGGWVQACRVWMGGVPEPCAVQYVNHLGMVGPETYARSRGAKAWCQEIIGMGLRDLVL